MLFAGRDRFGIKPLYYAVHDGTFYLASEVKALVAARRAAALGPRGALRHALRSDARADRTLFDGIYQVPPGSYLLTDGEHVQCITYWDFDYPRGRA